MGRVNSRLGLTSSNICLMGQLFFKSSRLPMEMFTTLANLLKQRYKYLLKNICLSNENYEVLRFYKGHQFFYFLFLFLLKVIVKNSKTQIWVFFHSDLILEFIIFQALQKNQKAEKIVIPEFGTTVSKPWWERVKLSRYNF